MHMGRFLRTLAFATFFGFFALWALVETGRETWDVALPYFASMALLVLAIEVGRWLERN